jgi:hypothetical protein
LKSGVQSAKVAANFVPTKEDYQKVRRLHWQLALIMRCVGAYVRYP